MEQRSSEWFATRCGKVTASRVADILATTKTGVSASRQNYLIELAIQRVTGVVEQSYTNAAMQWGIDTESQARAAYEVKTNSFVDQIGFVDHPKIENFGCSPDGLIDDHALVEFKAPNSSTHWEYFKANQVPKKYMIQIQTQLSVTGREWCDFVSFDPRMPERKQLLIIRVPRDVRMIEDIESNVEKFLIEVESEVKLMRSL